MSDLTLLATTRVVRGRHVHAERRQGKIPAILYGHNVTPRSLSAEARTLQKVWHRAGKTHLVDLVVDGEKAQKVLIRDLQFDPRTNGLVHADFFAVNLKEKLTADVPVVVVGSAPAVDEFKLGQLLQPLAALKVECLPQDLPAQITVDVSSLTELDAHILVGDLHLPNGVSLVHADATEVVVKVGALRVQAEEPEDEAAVAEAPAEAAGTGDAE